MELLLDGFEDDGQGQAEAAGGDADSAGFTPTEVFGGVGQGGFELFEDGGLVDEVIEVDLVAITRNQESKQVVIASGGAHFGQ